VSVTIFGIHSVRQELLSGKQRPQQLFLAGKHHSPRLKELASMAEKRAVPVREVSRKELDALVGEGHHQGVALQLKPFEYTSFETLLRKKTSRKFEKAFFLILDNISDPRNFGAIIRSADAAGCQGVIIPKDRACPVTGVVHKASAGALATVPVCLVTNLARAIQQMKKEGVWVFGLGAEAARPLYEEDLRGDLALVVGSEGKGLRPNIRKQCDALLAIPMSGRVSSLNVSVAASVAMFEVVRQRRKLAEQKTGKT
jgi:23S rRNA (guanosine2251-2'-O)-methyltransferase